MNVPLHQTAPYSGVPIIRISVYRCASTVVDKERRLAVLPKPAYAATQENPADHPQRVFGFKQPNMWPKDHVYEGRPCSGGFQVVSCKINHTRAWACSSATFTLAAPYDKTSLLSDPPVRPEDVVTIELGYAPNRRVSLTGGKAWFLPRFYGVVDTVRERGGNGDKDGVTFTVTARDAVRYLVDNKIRHSYLQDPNPNRQNRGYAIMDLLWIGGQIDPIVWESVVNEGGTEFKRAKLDANNMVIPRSYGPDNCYFKVGIIEASERADIQRLTDNNSGVDSSLYMDQFPLDIIKHLSLVESAPRELFADRTGMINWMCRRTDFRILAATPERRQYFYRLPTNRANIIAYAIDWTTAGSKSHFTISNGKGGNETGGLDAAVESPYAFLSDPHLSQDHQDHRLRRFTRQAFVYDDTLTSGDSGQEMILARALISTWGRDIQSGLVHVPGDPTLDIAQAIQLFNTGLFGRRFDPDEKNPEKRESGPLGVYRVEALQDLYAMGGTQRGYTSVIVFNTVDPPSFQIWDKTQAQYSLYDPTNRGKGIQYLSTVAGTPPEERIR